MRMLRWATCLWPGLPQLWIAGNYSGLALALGFALLLNLVLVSTLAWTELLNTPLSWAAWSGVAIFWLVSAWVSLRWLAEQPSASLASPLADELFREAQAQYIQGNWFETEVALGRLLESHPRDADARMLLATLFRRLDRADEAEAQLRVLEKLDGAIKWEMEIRQERQRLAEAAEAARAAGQGESFPWADIVPFAPAA